MSGSLLLGLIGSPIGSSAAPAMHEAMAAAAGMRCHYQLIDVAAADVGTLRAMLQGVRLLGFAGVNVTFPYKEAVVPLLDALAPGIAALGAVNTVVARGGKLCGYNTDSSGFVAAYRQVIATLPRRPVALVGAGGVGRAIGFALAELGAPMVHIVDRERGKAEALAAALGGRCSVRVCAGVAEASIGAEGIVNATPVGMLPSRESAIPEALLGPHLWVADAVYTPLWTPLLLAARARGAPIMTGRELAIFQAADAFALFSGRPHSPAPAAAAFDAVMRQREAGGSA